MVAVPYRQAIPIELKLRGSPRSEKKIKALLDPADEQEKQTVPL